VEWIAADWTRRAPGRAVPVAYELAVGPHAWWTGFVHRLDRWYPGQMSVGRGLDYDLLRRFHLRNAFEGDRDDATRRARYVVSYAAEPVPPAVPDSARHLIYGRLRLSVAD